MTGTEKWSSINVVIDGLEEASTGTGGGGLLGVLRFSILDLTYKFSQTPLLS